MGGPLSLTWHHAAEGDCPLPDEIPPNGVVVPHQEPDQGNLWHVHCEHQGLLPHGVKTFQKGESAFRCLIYNKQEVCLHKECLNCGVSLVFCDRMIVVLGKSSIPTRSCTRICKGQSWVLPKFGPVSSRGLANLPFDHSKLKISFSHTQ